LEACTSEKTTGHSTSGCEKDPETLNRLRILPSETIGYHARGESQEFGGTIEQQPGRGLPESGGRVILTGRGECQRAKRIEV